MRKSSITILVMLLTLGILALNASAQAPNTILYQGRLTNPAGAPLQQADVDSVHFTIYSEAMAVLYDTAVTDVTVDMNGVFTVELGPLAASVFSGEKRLLGIKVNTDPEMSPLQPLTSAPYAYSSNLATTINTIHNFTNLIRFGDSTMRVDNNGIRIGRNSVGDIYNLLYLQRNYNTTSSRTGLNSSIYNASTGELIGVRAAAVHSTAGSGGTATAFDGWAKSDGSNRYGVRVYSEAQNISITTGTSYGIRCTGYDGEYAYGVYAYGASATNNYGIYASCGNASGNYGGYFYGNLHSTGSNTKGAGGMIIDHPLDPENQYLVHSDIQSPDMMNVYNGNIVTDINGLAVVELPDYFEALNKDFRYQLTVIGDFAQAIVLEEISNNQFTVQTDKPEVKVSWQVTGIRKDAFAKANPMKVEVQKSADEAGLYMHPEAFGFGMEKSANARHHKDIPDEEARRND